MRLCARIDRRQIFLGLATRSLGERNELLLMSYRALWRRRLSWIAVDSPLIARRDSLVDFAIRDSFGLLLAGFVILQPGARLHVLFPCGDAGMAVMLFQLVLVVFYDGAPE